MNARRLGFGGIVLAALAMGGSIAHANMGQPWRDGEPAGEPGGIRAIAIARETLEIDLRPLARAAPIDVTATYQLVNRAAARRIELVFASGSQAGEFRITLDGRPITSEVKLDARLPDSWQAPTSTPNFGGGIARYEVTPAPPVSFTLDVPAGAHVLRVAYVASPGADLGAKPVLHHQFAYVLAPARTWAAFGGLDVTVQLPAGWDAVVTPALARQGDTLRGSFAAVPADSLALMARAPTGLHDGVRWLALAALAVVLIGGGVATRALAGRAARRRERASQLGDGWVGAWAAVGWAIGVTAVGLFVIWGPGLAISGQVNRRGLGDTVASAGVVLAGALVVVIGNAIARGASRAASR